MEEEEFVIKIGKCFVDEAYINIGSYRVSIQPKKKAIFLLSEAQQFTTTFGVGEIFTLELKPLLSHPLSESAWLTQLREVFDAKVSIPFDSFEVDWKSLYQSGWTPEEAAESAIKGLETE